MTNTMTEQHQLQCLIDKVTHLLQSRFSFRYNEQFFSQKLNDVSKTSLYVFTVSSKKIIYYRRQRLWEEWEVRLGWETIKWGQLAISKHLLGESLMRQIIGCELGRAYWLGLLTDRAWAKNYGLCTEDDEISIGKRTPVNSMTLVNMTSIVKFVRNG